MKIKKIFRTLGFSLAELVVVIAILATLSTVAYVGVRKVQQGGYNDKVLSDLIAISNSLEQYSADHFGKYPTPTPGDNQNINCYLADATYSHDCTTPAEFIAGRIDNALLTKRYLQEIPVDPYTNSRYAYGVSLDGRFFQVAGLWRNDDGSYSSRTAGNLEKGYPLPSLIRAYDGPNFVVNKGNYLPYHPTEKQLIATLRNYTGVTVTNDQQTAVIATGAPIKIFKDWRVIVNTGTAELYFGEGSISTLDTGTDLTLERMEIAEDDEDNFISKVRVNLRVGQIWSKISRLAQQSEFHIETTNGIAGVRGTEFGIDDTGAVEVAAGEVFLLSPTDVQALNGPDNIDKNNLQGRGQIRDSASNPVQPGTATYSDISLSNIIIPRILSASRTSLTIENLYITLGIDPLDPRSLPAGLSLEAKNRQGQAVQRTLTPVEIADRQNPYLLDITALTPQDEITVRFFTGPAIAPTTVSGFSYPAITFYPSVPSSRTIDETSIYQDFETKDARLSLMSPHRFTVTRGQSGPSATFAVGFKSYLLSLSGGPQVTLTATPPNVCTAPSTPLPLNPVNPRRARSSSLLVTAQGAGQCTLKATMTVAGGATFEDTTVVDIQDPGILLAGTGGGGGLISAVQLQGSGGATAVLSNSSLDLDASDTTTGNTIDTQCQWSALPQNGTGPIDQLSAAAFLDGNTSNGEIQSDGTFRAPQAAHGVVDITCTIPPNGATGQTQVTQSMPLTVVPDLNNPTITASANPTIGNPVTLTPQFTYNGTATPVPLNQAPVQFAWQVTNTPRAGLPTLTIPNTTGAANASFTPRSLLTPTAISGVGSYTVSFTATLTSPAGLQTENASQTVTVNPAWILAAGGVSCTVACGVQSALCMDGRGNADWNDTNTCTQCLALAPTGAGLATPQCLASPANFAPYFWQISPTNRRCYYRGGAGVQNLSCSIAAGAGQQRVCQCE